MIPGADDRTIPLWVKLLYTAVFLTIAYVNLAYYHWTQFLWFSHTALFLVLLAVWTEKHVLVGMAGISVLVFHTTWTVAFIFGLLTGVHPGAIAYMFDPATSLFLRSVSLFHVALPLFILWMLSKTGYDRRALKYQTIWGISILLLAFIATSPERNINWVYGPVTPQNLLPQPVYLAGLMVAVPLVIYLPTHRLLESQFGKQNN